MGKPSLFQIIREWIGGIAFSVFLWANRMTAEEYWNEISKPPEVE